MWKIVLVKEQDRGLIVGGGGGNKFSSQLKQNNLLSRLHVLFFRVCSSLCMFIVCVCVRCIGIWWGFRTLRFALQRTPLPPPPPPQKAVYEVSWELILTKTRAGTAARGAVCLNPAQARPPSETLCIYWNIYIHFWCRGKMLSVKSARQLCKVFFSLHVVFLSVALVESRASNGDQKGKLVLYRLIFMYVCVEFLFLFLFF